MILCIDTETTGLVTKSHDWLAQPGIVQIGAIKLERQIVQDINLTQRWEWLEVDKFYTLVNPEVVKWSDDAIKTHGITQNTVADAPTFFEIGRALARFAVGCDTWLGYNAEFDKSAIWHQLVKYALERNFPWPPEEIDVMRVAGRIMETQGKKGMKHPKLSDAYQHFIGKNFEGAHDALADIRATAAVWIKTQEGNYEQATH